MKGEGENLCLHDEEGTHLARGGGQEAWRGREKGVAEGEVEGGASSRRHLLTKKIGFGAREIRALVIHR